RAFHLKPNGAGYDCEKENLVTSTDNWFRLSDVCVAPDGSVILADWYDPGVGGHGMGDWTRGRIFRVTPKGHQGDKVPEVDVESKDGIVAALASPNLAVRQIAMAKLAGMEPDEARKLLEPLLTPKTDPWLRARALWQIARLVRRPEDILRNFAPLLREEDPQF